MDASLLPDPTAPIRPEPVVHFVRSFAESAARFAERLAVTDGTDAWTYAELDARTNQIASWLHDKGVNAGDVVAIHADRNTKTVAALVGVMKAGAAFMLLDAEYPVARLQAQIAIAEPIAWIEAAPTALLHRELSQGIAHVLDLTSAEALSDLSASPVALPGGTRAYVAFTSGTTGGPKAIIGTEAPLAHFVRWEITTFAVNAEDRFSVLSGIAHDPFLRDVLVPLSAGASVHLPARNVRLEPDLLVSWMAEQRITFCHLTPALGSLLTQARAIPLPSIRLFAFGGELLRGGLLGALAKLSPSAKFVNYYGTTETPQAMSFFVADPSKPGNVPVGRGIDGVDLLIVCEGPRLANVGEEGEIYVRTPFLAAGYADGRPGGFGTNPFTNDPNDRVYRTGDRGRYRDDGAVEVLGRADDQVKVRGFRVELSEVEQTLGEEPRIKEAAVVLREESQALVAYVVGDIDKKDVLAWARDRLPNYMVPSTVVSLGSLPLTPNGKIDRRALPPPERRSLPPPAMGGASPASPPKTVEGRIADIWREVLDIEHVDPKDNFFDVGGHSLNATQIATKIRAAFGIDLQVRTVFEAPTIAELAVKVRDSAASKATTPAVAAPPRIVRTPVEGGSVLSYWQESAVAFERERGPSDTALVTARLVLTGPLDVGALKDAIARLLDRQEALRQMVYVEEGKAPHLLDASKIVLGEHDVRTLDAAAARAVVEKHSLGPFAVGAEPLIRFNLLRTGDDAHELHLAYHQLVHDATDVELITDELLETYAAVVEKRAPSLPDLPVRYVDFAVWERDWFERGDGRKLIAPAKERVDRAKPIPLPFDRPRSGTYRGETVGGAVDVDPKTSAKFAQLCKSQQATLYMGMTAAVASVLSVWCNTPDVTMTSPINTRTHEALKSVCGRFGNWVPNILSFGGDPTLRDLLSEVRRDSEDALGSAPVPARFTYGTVDVFNHPLSRVTLNSPEIDAPTQKPRVFGGVTALLQNVEKISYRSRVDLHFRLIRFRGKIGGFVVGAADVFDKSTIEMVTGRLADFFRNARPEARIAEIMANAK